MKMVDIRAPVSVLLFMIIAVAFCSVDDADTDTKNKTYTGKNMYEFGRKFNMPLLRLIGKTFMNMEGRNSQCSEWSKWSVCRLVLGSFGVRTRDRKCGGSDLSDNPKVKSTNEVKSEVCENICVQPYVWTSGKFCLKFHNESKVTKSAAEKACQAEKGYLVNINSQLKWDAVDDYLQKNKYSYHMWIDGEKKTRNSDWEYSYEKDITGFSNWLSNEPSNGILELCKVNYFRSSQYKFIDAACTNNYYYICEKIV